MEDSKYVEVASQMWWVIEATGNMEKKGDKITFIK